MAKGTKSLNPADKARKEARKKELKKNKKQRQQVRSEAIEKRNAEELIADLENLDKQEYGPTTTDQPQQPVANVELLFKEKRKRLRALLARILEHYQKEDPERFAKLKKLESDYEAQHKRAEKEYEAIKAAKEVKIDDVVLPPDPDQLEAPKLTGEITDEDPLMSESIYVTPLNEGVNPPGCPPGPPPNLKILADQLEGRLLLPPDQLTTQHMPPMLPIMNRDPVSSMRHKKPPHATKRAKFGRPGQANAAANRSSIQRSEKHSDTQANRPPVACRITSGAGPTAIKAPVLAKKAVIESKPVIFVPKVTKFVPASVRSKLGTKAASDKDEAARP